MKAVVCTKYGPPDVLQFQEVETPTPGDDEVLVRIDAASVNAADWHMLRGKPVLARFIMGGLRKPKYTIPGSDIAGTVEATGKSVSQFRPGDEVFGALGHGAFAEYASVPTTKLLRKPAGVSFEAAAAIPIAGVTALQALRDHGHVQPGQKVLVNGASGGVGTFAVQLARVFGAEVTAVCSTRNMEMAHSIGADHVIDYTKEDFTRSGRQYDVIVDIAANHSVSALKRALSPDGVWVGTGYSNVFHLVQFWLLGSLASRTGSKKFGTFLARIYHKDQDMLRELLEAGKIAPVIDRRYPLSKTAEAMRYFGTGHARGKVVITTDPDSHTAQERDIVDLGEHP